MLPFYLSLKTLHSSGSSYPAEPPFALAGVGSRVYHTGAALTYSFMAGVKCPIASLV